VKDSVARAEGDKGLPRCHSGGRKERLILLAVRKKRGGREEEKRGGGEIMSVIAKEGKRIDLRQQLIEEKERARKKKGITFSHPLEGEEKKKEKDTSLRRSI